MLNWPDLTSPSTPMPLRYLARGHYLSARQPRAGDAIAELHGGAAIVGAPRDVHMVLRSAAVQRVASCQSRSLTRTSRVDAAPLALAALDVGQRRLAQFEASGIFAGVAAAEKFLDRLAVGARCDVGVESEARPRVALASAGVTVTVAPLTALTFTTSLNRFCRGAVLARRRELLSKEAGGIFRQLDHRAADRIVDRLFGHLQKFALREHHRVAVIRAIEQT